MNLGILSTETHPLIKYYLSKFLDRKIKNFILILDKKKTSIKDKNIFNHRTKNYFKNNQNLLKILKKKKIKYYLVSSHNSKSCLKLIRSKNIDILANCGTPRKIQKKIIDSLKYGVLNVHPGILPKYKGRTCVEWSIFNDDKVGNTLHFMNSSYDSGPIIKKVSYSFLKTDNYYSIRTKVYVMGVELMVNYLKKLQNMKIKKIKLIRQKKFNDNLYDVIDKKKMRQIMKKIKNGEYKYQY